MRQPLPIDSMTDLPTLVPSPPNVQELERLGDEIAELSAPLDAATARLLALIREFDARGGWNNGFRSCAEWLAWRVGMDPGAARERVRVARALATLPQLAEALAKGQLSYAKVRALTRVATPEIEARLLAMGQAGTATHVERIVRGWRRIDRKAEARDAARQHALRALHVYQDDDGTVIVRGRMTPEAGALLLRALDAAREALYQRARACSANPTDPAMDAPVLTDSSEPGQSVLEEIGHVSAETSQRLACDASRVVMRHDEHGRLVEVGARTRTIPPAIRRALLHRDRTCRFPGCEARVGQGHHIQHWARGGPTTLTNLVLLCRRHHRTSSLRPSRLVTPLASSPSSTRRSGFGSTHGPAVPAGAVSGSTSAGRYRCYTRAPGRRSDTGRPVEDDPGRLRSSGPRSIIRQTARRPIDPGMGDDQWTTATTSTSRSSAGPAGWCSSRSTGRRC